MKKALLTISAITTALTGLGAVPAAYAQDDKNFEGVKVGVQAGWERRKINETVLSPPNAQLIADKARGLAYGGFVGYDAQLGDVVLGVEADFSPNGKTLRSTLAGGGSIELDSKWAATLSARAGVAVTPKLLAYGRLGYGMNRYTIKGFAAGNTTPIAVDKATGDGFVYGGGLEFAFSRNASFRVEYRRNDLEASLGSDQVLGGVTLRF